MKKVKNILIHILGGYTIDDVVKERIDERRRAYGHALSRCDNVEKVNLGSDSPYNYVRKGIEYLYNLECDNLREYIASHGL